MSIQTELERITNAKESSFQALELKGVETPEGATIEEISTEILSLPFGNIPKYHNEEAGRVIKRLLELKGLYPNNICFGTISDNHINKSDNNSIASARHAAYALETIGLMAQCDFVANLGDNVTGSNIDNDTEYANAVYMENCTRYAFTSQVGYSLVGNHDKSGSTQKLFNLMGKFNDFDNYGTTQIRGFGYKDYTANKVRVICLNTCDYWNGQGGNGMSYEQKDFLMKALDLSSQSNYESWTIVILSHIPLDFLGGDYNKGADLKEILKAYCDGTTANITVNSNYANAQNEGGKYSGTLSYDYAGKNAPKVIHIHGHIHTNKFGKLKFIDDNTELDIYRVATPNSSFNGNASTDRYTNYGDYSITTTEADKIKKIAGTKADTSATFYFIDLENQVIYSVGYGADIDRTIAYKSATIYTINYELTLCTVSNSIGTAVEGTSYNTTVVPTDADGVIKSVVVKMGGVDITNSCYSNGVINISEVTGNISITAVAELPLVSETITPHIAPRSTWYQGLSGGRLTLGPSNTECALGVSTANAYSFTDRSSKTFYLMPIDSKYCKATLNYSATDGLAVSYLFQAIKDNGGSFTSVKTVGKGTSNVITWDKGKADYLLISIEHTDGATKWDWNSSGKTITVTFSNQ